MPSAVALRGPLRGHLRVTGPKTHYTRTAAPDFVSLNPGYAHALTASTAAPGPAGGGRP